MLFQFATIAIIKLANYRFQPFTSGGSNTLRKQVSDQLSNINYQILIVSFALTITHALRKFFFVVLLLGAPFFCCAQGQGNIWHFGYNAGIDFNSGTAVNIVSPLSSWEGCSSICNASGNLLFSTNGITVYNSIGGIMATGLLGDLSSTQSPIIVPFPGNNSQYYIFTVDDEAGPDGLCYSIVDMTLNGGLGGITALNVPLLSLTCEKITAVAASNGIDYWLITHKYGNNEYYAFNISAAGISAPVISAIGFSVNISFHTVGYLKSSPNGSKLACVFYDDPGISYFQVSDFNNTTGVVSNLVDIATGFSSLYGCCFSPDNSKLYLSVYFSEDVLQFDLLNPNYDTDPPYQVHAGTTESFGAMQLAPDGKIYIAQDNGVFLSTIDSPDNAGSACSFSYNSFALFGSNSGIGLPDFIENYFINPVCNVDFGNDTSFCNEFLMILNAGISDSIYLWSDGSTTQFLTVDTPGVYSVIKILEDGCVSMDTIIISLFPELEVSLGPNVVACYDQPVLLDAGPGYSSYHWSNSTADQTLTPVNSGNYFVHVTDTNGCYDMDTVNVFFIPPANPLGNNWSLCSNDSLLLNAGSGFAYYEWSTGSFDSSILINTGGSYSVTVKDTFGCLTIDSIIISLSTPAINIGADTLFCGAFNYSITAGSGFANYHWQNNSSNSTYIITSAGLYSVTVTDIYGCSASDAITILNNLPQVSIGNDTIICINTSATIIATTGFDTYMWNTGSTVGNIVATTEGVYSVTVTDSEGCTTADYKNISINNPILFIGNDTSTCNGNGIMLDAGNSFVNYLWSNNSVEQLITTSGAGIYSVTVTDFYGCTVSDEATITYSNCVDIIVPTGFTPNGDGLNNFFHILNASDFKSAEIKIYNRWGQLLFESRDANASWNGKYNGTDCEVGVYVFVITGKNFLNHPVFKAGNITLIR